MAFKLLSFILIVFLFAPSVALADPMDAGREMILNAVDKIPERAADKMLATNFGVSPANLSDSGNVSPSAKMIGSYAAAEQHPESIKWVTDERKNDYLTYILIGLILLIWAAGYFFIQKIYPTKAAEVTEFFTGAQQFIGYKLFFETLFLLIALPTILPIVLDYSIQFEQAWSSGIMQDTLEYIPLSTENIPLYFYQAIAYILSGSFFLARIELINVTYAKVLFLALALAIPWNFIRYIGIGVFLYFETALFMRPVVLLINAITVKQITSMSTTAAFLTMDFTYGLMVIVTVLIVFLATMWPFVYLIYLMFRSKPGRYISRMSRRH